MKIDHNTFITLGFIRAIADMTTFYGDQAKATLIENALSSLLIFIITILIVDYLPSTTDMIGGFTSLFFLVTLTRYIAHRLILVDE